jgi:hypothetical protein
MLGLLPPLLAAASAGAETPRRFQLEYRAAPSCPEKSELVRQIALRVPRATEVSAPPSEVAAAVAIEVEAGRYHAVIDLQRPDGKTRRDVDATDCEEVTRAAALIVALAIDPDAALRPAPEPAQHEPEPVRAAPAPAPALTPQPSTEPRPVSPPASRALPWRFELGAELGASGGVGPDPVLYEGGFVEAGRAAGPVFAPAARISLRHGRSQVATEAGSAELDLLTFGVAACPLRFGTQWFAEPCVTFDYARLRGTGYQTRAPASATAAFWAPGALVRAGTIAFDRLTLSVEAGATTPLSHDRFFFAPDTTAYRVPSLTGYAGIGLGVAL